MKPNKYLGALAISGLLVGCGSSGDNADTAYEPIAYEGKTAAYTLTGNEDDALATSMEFAYLGLRSKESGYFVFQDFEASAGVMIETLEDYSQSIRGEVGAGSIPSEPLEGNCNRPGSVSFSGNYQDFSVRASSFCYDDGVDTLIIDGEASFKVVNGITTLEYEDFSIDVDEIYTSISGRIVIEESGGAYTTHIAATITENGKVDSVNMTATCTVEPSCSYDAVYTGDNGKIYKVEGLTYREDPTTTLLEADLYLPEYGLLKFGALNISICEDWTVGDGRLGLNDGVRYHTMIYSGCGVEPTPDTGDIIFE